MLINRINNLRIRSKFILLYVLGVFLPLSLILTFFTNTVTEEIRHREKKNAEISFERVVGQMETQFQSVFRLSNAVSTDAFIKQLITDAYPNPPRYYEVYHSLLRPQIQRYINAFSQNITYIQVYTSNPTTFSGGMCMSLQDATSLSWMAPETGDPVCVPSVIHPLGSGASRVQLYLLRWVPGLQPYRGLIKLTLYMEPLRRCLDQEQDYLDVYLIAPDGKLASRTNATNLRAEDVRASLPPEEMDMEYSLDRVGGMAGWRVGAIVNTLPMERSVRRAMVICLLTGILCLGFAGVLSYLLSSSISRRSQKLLQSMDSASAEDFRPVDTPVAHDEIGELTVHFNAMRQRLKELIEDVYLLQLRQKNMELERVRGELKYLQAQLDPHFLFNTLNGMLVLCVRNGYADLAEVVRALSRLMRRMLDTRRDRVPLGEEISFVRMVLQIERFRFGDKLTYEIDIDESLLDYTVPMISVQGLVENACKHGVQPQSGPGIIRIFAGREAKMLRVTVQDNGIGMTGEQLEQLRQNLVSEEPSAGGVGLQNLYRRLKLLYGEDARLNIDAKKLQGTTVSFIIPLEREEEHVSSAAGR